jgi:hypothetical protein
VLYLLYSDDYEVFLGGNYKPETEVLVDATEKLLAVCGDMHIPMTLFADVCCLWRYRELGHDDFPRRVEEQLCRAVGQGHDVQTHLHPHWLTTEVQRQEGGRSQYDYDRSRFLLANCAQGGDDRLYDFTLGLLARAKTYLTDLLRPVVPEYRCVAFRAGGYGIQPGTEAILAALQDAGYLIDSSVVPGMRLVSNVNQIDFTAVPRQGNCWLSRKSGLRAPSSDGVYEIPVAAARLGRTTKVKRRVSALFRRRGPTSGGKLSGWSAQDEGTPIRRSSLILRLFRFALYWPRPWSSLELYDDPAAMLDVTRAYVNKCGTQDGDLYFSFSCHSKVIDQGRLDALREYHRRVERRYGSSLRAITFQEAADRIAATSSPTDHHTKPARPAAGPLGVTR